MDMRIVDDVDCGLWMWMWMVDCGLWIADCGLQIVDYSWIVDR